MLCEIYAQSLRWHVLRCCRRSILDFYRWTRACLGALLYVKIKMLALDEGVCSHCHIVVYHFRIPCELPRRAWTQISLLGHVADHNTNDRYLRVFIRNPQSWLHAGSESKVKVHRTVYIMCGSIVLCEVI